MNDPLFFKVLVCGGRSYGWKIENGLKVAVEHEQRNLYRALDKLLRAVREEQKNLIVIHGAADGADSLSDRWARERQVEIEVYPADWKKYGRSAGYIRNSQMLKEGKPDLILAFPGGAGTKMMVSLSEKEGVPVRRY